MQDRGSTGTRGAASRGRARAWALVAALPLTACAADDDRVRAFDLAAELGVAEVSTETRQIEPGSADGRRHLVSGFSRAETDPRGRGFAWSLGPSSTVEFQLIEPRAVELVLEGRSFGYDGAPEQAVTLTVNGEAVGGVEMGPALAEHRLTLPAEHFVAGANRLELAYRHVASPRALGLSDDRRELAVAWYGFRFGDASARPKLPIAAQPIAARPPAARPPAEAGEPPVLAGPSGARIDYYREPEPGSELRVERWSSTGAGRLEVELATDGGETVRLATLEGGGEDAAWSLPSGERQAVRLTLRALAPPETTGRGEVVLAGAAVWSSPAPWHSRQLLEPAPRGAPATPPNIVVYLIDTLRADRLGCYGYGRPTSPEIDAFAGRAVLFEHAVAQSSWTRSAVASIFTGLWPAAHGTNGRSDRLADDAVTLAERLRDGGYLSAAFVTNPNVTRTFGFDQGFDPLTDLGEDTPSGEVHRAVEAWLDARDGQAPFFLYVHTLDPHAPYDPPERFRERLAPGVSADTAARSLELLRDLQAGRREVTDALTAELEALYDAEVAANDASFGALVDALEARGLYDDALIVLVSDHGEEFLEHGGWQHGHALHAESIDVPLVIKPPGWRAGKRIASLVQHVDVTATVTDAAGLAVDPAIEGRSLLPVMADETTVRGEVPVFSYLHLDGPARASVHDRGWKLILERQGGGELGWPRLYRPGEDPGETRNLAGRFEVRAALLAAKVREKLADGGGHVPAQRVEIDEAVRGRLEALGYLD